MVVRVGNDVDIGKLVAVYVLTPYSGNGLISSRVTYDEELFGMTRALRW